MFCEGFYHHPTINASEVYYALALLCASTLNPHLNAVFILRMTQLVSHKKIFSKFTLDLALEEDHYCRHWHTWHQADVLWH